MATMAELHAGSLAGDVSRELSRRCAGAGVDERAAGPVQYQTSHSTKRPSELLKYNEQLMSDVVTTAG